MTIASPRLSNSGQPQILQSKPSPLQAGLIEAYFLWCIILLPERQYSGSASGKTAATFGSKFKLAYHRLFFEPMSYSRLSRALTCF